MAAPRIYKNLMIHLDKLEDYVEKANESKEYFEKCRELAEEYYDLMGEFYKVFDKYQRVWGVEPINEKYIYHCGIFKKVFKTKNILLNSIRRTIQKKKLDVDDIPDIAAMEYILIPTGNIYMYKPKEDAAVNFQRSDDDVIDEEEIL